MFSLHNFGAFLLPSLAVFVLTGSINSQLEPCFVFCPGSYNVTDNPYYKSNVTPLLDFLYSITLQGHSYDHKTANNCSIYLLFLCRGEVSTSSCQTCVYHARHHITTQCPATKSAIIWCKECMLRQQQNQRF